MKTAAAVMARPGFPVRLLAASLALVTLALYWPAMSHEFVNYDDPNYVTANPHVQGGLSWAGVVWAFSTPVCCNWHPLTVLSHMVDCQAFGLNPWGHHLINVLLHALNAALVFVVLHQMTGARWRSLLVAALFAVHPLRVESVAWVAERKDVLSTLFWLLTLWAYVRHVDVQSPKSKAQSPPPSRITHHASRYYLLSLLFFALGLMSKPMVVTLPCVLLLLDYWPLGRFRLVPARTLVVEKLPFFLAAAVFSVVTFVVQQQGGAVVGSAPFAARAANALVSYCRYLGKLFWPVNLAPFYPGVNHWPVAAVAAAGLLLAAVSAAAITLRRAHPYVLVGWLWFLGTLVPVIGLVQVGGQSMADRYSYVPVIGILLALVWGARELTRGWRYERAGAMAIGAVAVLLCAGATRQQLGHWKNSETLFRHTLAVTGNNYLAHTILGAALQAKGRIDEAFSQYQQALRLKPDYALAHNNLGTALARKGQAHEAIKEFQEALRLKPDYAEAHYNLGSTRAEQGQADEAIREFEEAIRLKPDYADAHYNLGNELVKQSRPDDAIRQYNAVIRLQAGDADAHYSLGEVLARKGQIDEAITQYKAAVRFKPDDAEAHYSLGNLLAKRNRPGQAIIQFQEAVRLKPDHAEAHYNLGNELTKRGQLDEASRHYQAAIRVKPDHAEAHYNFGNLLAARGGTDAAIAQFREALRLKPANADAHFNLAFVLIGRGQTNEAIGEFQAALRLNPQDAEAHCRLGTALAGTGQVDEAIGHYQAALRLRPDYPEVRTNLDLALGRKNAPAGR